METTSRNKRSSRRLPWVATLVALALMFVSEAGAKQCYPTNLYDRDRDGYADLRGLDPADEQFTLDSDALNCPAGYVSKAGDCNDAVASIHPGRGEIGYNGVDDNCNARVDEPTMQYFPSGNLNTTSSFRMSVLLNHRDILNAALSNNNLYAEIEYAKLSRSQLPTTVSVTQVTSYGGSFNALLTLNNLSSITPYRARVRFYKRLANGSYQQVGETSDWYYTTTDGASDKTHKRALMVLKGLNELSESDNEKVGYRGTVNTDGTRYGASRNEKWCSEFYAWVTGTFLRGVSGKATVSELVDVFDDAGGYYPAAEIPTRAAPGDYLPLDTDKDGDANHSAMFLAYDASQSPAAVWTLEGNSGNKVKVHSRDFDYVAFKVVNLGIATVLMPNRPVFTGLGYILQSQLQ